MDAACGILLLCTVAACGILLLCTVALGLACSWGSTCAYDSTCLSAAVHFQSLLNNISVTMHFCCLPLWYALTLPFLAA
jgi:hypothetical protein